MASDDYRPPWLPVNPVPEPAETGGEAPEGETDTAPTADSDDPPLATPLAPEGPPAAPYAPFGNRSAVTHEKGSSPSIAAAAAFFGGHRERVAAQREATGEGTALEDDALEGGAVEGGAVEGGAVEETEPQAPVPPMSPYLSGMRPGMDSRADQPEGPASAQESWAAASPPSPPVTGATPTVRPDDLTPTKPQVPHKARPVTPTPAPGQEPTESSIPTPIEADDAEIIAPILPPPSEEIMPRGDEEPETSDASAPGLTPWSVPRYEHGSSDTDSSPDHSDSVRQLGASAVSNASLQAAGAPTPRGGVPRVDQEEDTFPSFGDDAPFVPRYEPLERALPPQTPSVSFTEPEPRPTSPLSDIDLPETGEFAYTPRVHPSSGTPDESGAIGPAPARPWVPVMEGGVTAAMTPNADSDDNHAPGEVWYRPANPRLPMPPIRNKTDSPTEVVPDTEASDTDAPDTDAPDTDAPDTQAPDTEADLETKDEIIDDTEINDEINDDSTSDAGTNETGARDPEPTDPESTDQESSTGEQEVATEPGRKVKRWVWWLIGGVIVAIAAAVVIFSFALRPDAITLPVPTVTASPAEPESVPIRITDPTDFVAALPATVETYTLDGYESIDPLTEAGLPARVAEHHTLTYGDGTATAEFVVNAYQHYNVEDAQTAYDTWAADATEVEPVLVDGDPVGDRALMTEGAAGTVVWRNVTAVFVLTGPADSILDFYDNYGV